MQGESQEIHHPDTLLSCLLSTVTRMIKHHNYFLPISISFFFEEFFNVAEKHKKINER